MEPINQHLIRAVTQSAMRHFRCDPEQPLDAIDVLLTAPTGKAAFNIRGLTLHTTFGLPLNGEELKKSDADTLNAFVCLIVYRIGARIVPLEDLLCVLLAAT